MKATTEMATNTHLNKRKTFCLSERNSQIILKLSGTVWLPLLQSMF